MPPETTNQKNPARSPARTFEDWVVWEKAQQFVLSVYRFSEGFPAKEIYELLEACSAKILASAS